MDHLKEAYIEGFANGLAAGSMFVYHGDRKAVLVNYPERKEILKNFS
jgi:cyclase